MGATYRDLYGGDAVAQALANSRKLQERQAREYARRRGEMPREFANGVKPPVVQRKEEKPVEDPFRKLRQGGRTPVQVLVYIGEEPMRFEFAANMAGTLRPAQMSAEALREQFAKMMKDAFG